MATAGARTAAESERLYSESGPGNVWSLEARQCGPSTASAGDTRLHRGWGWPGSGPAAAQAGPQSHTTTVALEISSEQLGLVCM